MSWLIDNIKIAEAGESAADFTDHFDTPSMPEGQLGPLIPDFAVNSTKHPGLCSAVPESGSPGEEVDLFGQDFGAIQGGTDKVLFGQLNAFLTLGNWTDSWIKKARIPSLEAGSVGLKVVHDGQESNAIKFFINAGVSADTPLISNISPDNGAKGEYITISGSNFGDQRGRVWFKEINNGQAGDAIDGDLDSFPLECRNVWSDKQVIVKFPKDKGAAGKSYYVQVHPADVAAGWSPVGPTFALHDGSPNPGICDISPSSGPVPFANGAPKMKIAGEYFGDTPEVYFWKTEIGRAHV
jgi:hypothetical protein